MGVPFEVLASRLPPDSSDMFSQMVACHLEAGSGDRFFIQSDSMAGSSLTFVGPGRTKERWSNIDRGALQDLASYGLLRAQGGRNWTYRVTADGLAFYRWWMADRGTPIENVESEVRRVLDGAAFASKHSGAAHHLREAFDLLWNDRLDDQAVSELGDHLRKALMDTVTDVVGDTAGKQERPIERLRDWLAGRQLSDREREVLAAMVELARVTLKLDHRLNHIRDEADLDEPPATRAELRRAAFVTAMVCQQLTEL